MILTQIDQTAVDKTRCMSPSYTQQGDNQQPFAHATHTRGIDARNNQVEHLCFQQVSFAQPAM
jgi:hypothetical protein